MEVGTREEKLGAEGRRGRRSERKLGRAIAQAGKRKLQSFQNLDVWLSGDIKLARINSLGRGAISDFGSAYHSSATQHSEQK